jgi:N-acetylmuramoyl-L-alanine amidase
MAQLMKTLLVAGIILVAGVSVGTSAFTSATVERQANADVVTDQNGLLGLTDGNSGNLVYQDASDQLAIDFENGTALGANTDALFELGDSDNPGTSQAFQVTNNDAESHQITAAYTLDADDGNTAANLEYRVYDDTGTLVGTVTEEGQTVSMNAAAAESYNVVVVVDTGHGAADTLTSAGDLSGTLAFTIDDVAEGGTISDGS